MAEPLAAVEQLPEIYGALAGGMRQAASEWSRQSRETPAILAQELALRFAEIQTKLFVTLDQRRLWFGFAGRSRGPEVLLDCRVGFRVQPEAERTVRAPLHPATILHEVRMPAFLALAPELAERDRARAVLGASGEPVEFLRLDKGWLAVRAPEDLDRVELAWRLDSHPEWRLAITRNAPGSRSWEVAPLLALSRTIGRWIRGLDPPVHRTVALPPPTDPERIEASLFVLGVLASAWAEALNRIEHRLPTSTPAQQPLDGQPLTISGYRADVRLLVDPSGRLVRKQGQPEAFQLRGVLEAVEDAAGVARTSITVEPPDFLVDGALYQAFLDEIGTPAAARRIATQLGLPGHLAAVQDWVASARRSLASGPLVFRIRRGRQDTNLVTGHGLLLGRSVHLVLRGAFTVDAEADAVRLNPESLEVLLSFPPVDPNAASSARPEVLADSFLRLIRMLLLWREALS